MSLLHYLKFLLFHATGLLAILALLAGGAWISYGLLAILLIFTLGDALGGDDTSTPLYRYPALLTLQLWTALPLLASLLFVALWSVSRTDVLGFGAWLGGLSGYDLLGARQDTWTGHYLSTWLLCGLMIGMLGTITAHELIHRTWDPLSLLIGRWLLAFSFDCAFAIEHVYGHHRYVATHLDPATAPRGRSVYRHILLSTLHGNRSAWQIERQRLARQGWQVFGWHNRLLRGYLMSLLLVGLAYLISGWPGTLLFIASGLCGKALLEIVNYMEHYGLLRDPHQPVQPRHSWNSNKRLSSWAMFNLTRHSHHHAQGELPYTALQPMRDAPLMLSGYLSTLLVTLLPPLWHRLMAPRLLDWDRQQASATERQLAAEANARSGIAALRPASSTR